MSDADLIRGLYDAFAAGNVPAVLESFDGDIEWTEAEGFMYAGTYNGPHAVLGNVLMKFGTEWEGFQATPTKIVDGGDGSVAAFGTYSGKYLATGKSMSVPFAHEWTVRDGKVVSFRQHTDTAVINRELGL